MHTESFICEFYSQQHAIGAAEDHTKCLPCCLIQLQKFSPFIVSQKGGGCFNVVGSLGISPIFVRYCHYSNGCYLTRFRDGESASCFSTVGMK